MPSQGKLNKDKRYSPPYGRQVSSKPPEVPPYEHRRFTADQAHRAQIFSVEGPQALKENSGGASPDNMHKRSSEHKPEWEGREPAAKL
jgi:hypothetical protein